MAQQHFTPPTSVEAHWSAKQLLRSVAAVTLAICLSAFFAAPAWSFKAGSGADDTVALPTYADAAAYLADADREEHQFVSIGGSTYDVEDLEEINDLSGLTDSNLPTPVTVNYRTTAVGDGAEASGLGATAIGEDSRATSVDSTAVGSHARATFKDSTAVGSHARALAESATAVGDYAGAYGEDSIAIGDYAHAYSDHSVALGRFTLVQGNTSTATGGNSTIVGQRSSTFGWNAKSIGDRNTVLGRSAQAVDIPFDPSADNALSEDEEFGNLTACAYRPMSEWLISDFTSECAPSFLSSESSDPRLGADTQAGEMFREEIRQRLRDRIDTFAVGRATAVGESATVYGNFGTAIGHNSRASYLSLGVGANTVASGQRSTAVGAWAHVTGDYSVGLGVYAQSHGVEGMALGRHTGAGSWTIWSHYDNAADFVSNHEDDLTDPFVVVANSIYSVRDLRAISSLTDNNLPTPVSTDTSGIIAALYDYESVEDYLADSSRFQYSHVIIGDSIYLKTDLDAVSNLTPDTLPQPVSGAAGALAVGYAAQAVAEDSIALGRQAVAVGSNGIAIGAEVFAGENDVVVGTTDHEYFLPGLSASQTANTELVAVDSSGQLSGDGGALHGRVDTVETGLGAASDSASSTGSVYARIASLQQLMNAMGDEPTGSEIAALRQAVLDVEASIGDPADQADAAGTAYARIADVQGDIQTVGDSLGDASDAADAAGSAYARIADLSTELGTTADSGDADGSAFAQINQLQEDLGTSSDEASSTGNAYERIKHVQDAINTATADDQALIKAIADTTALTQETRSLVDSSITDVMQIEDSVEKRLADIQTNARNQVLRIIHRDQDTGDRTVVALRGPTNEQIQTLVSLITSGAAPDTVIRGADGSPIGTTAKEFRALDDSNSMGEASEPEPIPIGSNNRLGYLFEALYGDPTDGIVYGSATDSETPHENSAFGRIGALEEGSLAKPYRAAPAVGSGMNAPRSADKRRIVVQDENADGSIRLSTISFSDIMAVDQRVEELDGRLDKATAMSSALTGLPNMVPGSGQYFAGVGLGSYGGEAAVAIGGAARVRDNLYINVGASTSSSGGGQAIRAGAGFVW